MLLHMKHTFFGSWELATMTRILPQGAWGNTETVFCFKRRIDS